MLVVTKPVDFRKGADGVVALVREQIQYDPFCGAIFIFRSKRADRLKICAERGIERSRAERVISAGWAALAKIAIIPQPGKDRRGKARADTNKMTMRPTASLPSLRPSVLDASQAQGVYDDVVVHTKPCTSRCFETSRRSRFTHQGVSNPILARSIYRHEGFREQHRWLAIWIDQAHTTVKRIVSPELPIAP